MGLFLYTAMFRLALGPAQPSIQCELGALTPGVKWPGNEAGHSPAYIAEVKNVCGCTSTPPVRLHGVLLC
jgi:hypothetical protein